MLVAPLPLHFLLAAGPGPGSGHSRVLISTAAEATAVTGSTLGQTTLPAQCGESWREPLCARTPQRPLGLGLALWAEVDRDAGTRFPSHGSGRPGRLAAERPLGLDPERPGGGGLPGSPAPAPQQWEGRQVVYRQSSGRNSRALLSYDGLNQRVRVLDERKALIPCKRHTTTSREQMPQTPFTHEPLLNCPLIKRCLQCLFSSSTLGNFTPCGHWRYLSEALMVSQKQCLSQSGGHLKRNQTLSRVPKLFSGSLKERRNSWDNGSPKEGNVSKMKR
ncbi:LOW QUALITY PROTEIN: Mammalian ependymin-related protein 1, partial [Plecturocebus cupreus]